MNVDISPEELEQIKRLCEGLINRIDEVKKLAQTPENEDETIDETETKVTFTMSFDAVKRLNNVLRSFCNELPVDTECNECPLSTSDMKCIAKVFEEVVKKKEDEG